MWVPSTHRGQEWSFDTLFDRFKQYSGNGCRKDRMFYASLARIHASDSRHDMHSTDSTTFISNTIKVNHCSPSNRRCSLIWTHTHISSCHQSTFPRTTWSIRGKSGNARKPSEMHASFIALAYFTSYKTCVRTTLRLKSDDDTYFR